MLAPCLSAYASIMRMNRIPEQLTLDGPLLSQCQQGSIDSSSCLLILVAGIYTEHMWTYRSATTRVDSPVKAHPTTTTMKPGRRYISRNMFKTS